MERLWMLVANWVDSTSNGLVRQASVPGRCFRRIRVCEMRLLARAFSYRSAFFHEGHACQNGGGLFQPLQIFAREVAAGERGVEALTRDLDDADNFSSGLRYGNGHDF